MFRLLAMFPNLELLRFVCAVVMAIAVNGMHYTGMAAATFKYEAGRTANSGYLLVSVGTAVIGALIGTALFLSFVFIIAVSDLRVWYYNLSKMFYELDSILEIALLEPSMDKRAAFLAAYTKFRQNEANDKAINEFRLSGRDFSKSNVKSNNEPRAPDVGNISGKSGGRNSSAKFIKSVSSLKGHHQLSNVKDANHAMLDDLERGKLSEIAEDERIFGPRLSNI